MKVLPCDTAELARTLFAESPDALFLFDLTAETILSVNPVAERLTGASATRLIGTPIRALFQAEIPDDVLYLQYPCREREGFLLRHQANGDPFPIALTVTHLTAQARPVGLLRVRDLRAHREARTNLRQKEDDLRRVLASVSDCVWSAESDAQGGWHALYCSPVIETITGRPLSTFNNDPERWMEIIHPEDRACYREQTQTMFARMEPCVIEYRIMLPSGASRWVRDSLRPTRLPDGRLRLDTVCSDVTPYKMVEERLRGSERKYRDLVETCNDLIWSIDTEGRWTYVNRQALQATTGYEPEEVLGRPMRDFLAPEVVERDTLLAEGILQGKPVYRHETVMVHKNGGRVEVSVNAIALSDEGGRPIGVTGTATDITSAKQAEAALRRSEARYRGLWQRNLAGIVRASLDGRILDCNDSFARMFGYGSREDMFTRSTKELYHDLGVRREFVTRLREQHYLTNYEIQMRRADGSAIWVLENVSLLVEDGQELLEAILIDITERKQFEEALRASENNYRTLITQIDQAIFLKDRALRYVTVNPNFCASLNKTEEELVGKTISELFPPNPVSQRSQAIEARVLSEGRAIETEETIPVDGRPRTIRVNRTPVKNPDGTVVGVLGICWDVTDQRALETQLRHVQKMDAIGQLAGGIAHDFNNLLTIMLGNLSYVLAQTQDWQASVELLKNAEKAGLRAAELTQTLLGFSRRAALATVPFNLNHAIDEVVRLTRSALPANIEIEVHADPHLWLVQADPGNINQVLTNLTLNARDALPGGGKIIYQTSHFVPDSEYLGSHVEASPGEFVRLRVRDTGEGIPAELRQRIFEPFFTTKEKGKGTGLGLAIVFSIVKQHNGWVVCESEPGRGTTFDIFLPRCDVASSAGEMTGAPADAAAREVILLVDDEHMIRQLTRTILTRAGFQVLLAEDGVAALELLRAHRHKIVLIILDAIMPRMSGRETLRELANIAPDIGVLFSSGYSTEQMAVNEFPQVRGFLPKPYRAEQLIEKVIEILGAARLASEQSS